MAEDQHLVVGILLIVPEFEQLFQDAPFTTKLGVGHMLDVVTFGIKFLPLLR